MPILPTKSPENYELEDIMELIKNVRNLALEVMGAVAVIFLIIGAYFYLTAYGNEEKAQKGKTIIIWTIVGIIVILLASVIIELVSSALI